MRGLTTPEPSVVGRQCDEASWVAWMTGFPVQISAPDSRCRSEVGYVTTSRGVQADLQASPTDALRGAEQVWVDADRRRLVLPNGSEPPAPPRTLWFNAALVALLVRGGLLVHAAGVTLRGRGLMLLGQSGVGKSTLAGLLEDAFPGSVLGDERIAVTPPERAETDEAAGAWNMVGSPWASSAGIARRLQTPLTALVFLEQRPANSIQPLERDEALLRLLPLVSVDWSIDDLANRATQALDRLLTAIPSYRFGFVKDPSAARHLDDWATRPTAP